MHKPIPAISSEALERFNAAFVRGEGCWNWEGRKTKSGYGRISVRNAEYRAHRLSYAIHRDIDPGEKLVCHSCDNPACVNPDHLWLGTPKNNTDDMVRKGRASPPPGYVGPHHWRVVPTHCAQCGHHRIDDLVSGKWRACRPCHLRRSAARKRAR